MKTLSEVTGRDALHLAARDVLTEAAERLEEGHDVLGCWLLQEPVVEQLKTPDDVTAPRATTRGPASADDAEFVQACGVCATALLNELEEDARHAISVALRRGPHLRVYARPDSGEVAVVLAALPNGQCLELARYVIASNVH